MRFLRFGDDFAAFSADEARAWQKALKTARALPDVEDAAIMERCLAAVLLARQRAGRRRESDARTDHARRTLVGARLPREVADKYRSCASAHGLSLYRFASNALEREYWRLTDQN